MTKPLQQWTVLPHGRLVALGENLLTVSGDIHMPLIDLPRRMTIVRLDDGRLIVFSAIALDEPEMRQLERYGRLSFLVIPSDHHRLDAKIWKNRYPALQVVTPQGAREKVEDVVPVDTDAPDFGDPDVDFVTVPGTRNHEAALVVRSRVGTTLIVNDLVANIRHASGFGNWLLRTMGFAGDEPQIPTPIRLGLVKDKALLREQLLRWADIPDLRRILVSHGAPIDESPAKVLRGLAETLA